MTGTGCSHPNSPPAAADRSGSGQERHQALGHGHRSGAGPAAAVGGGEGLVQVHVDDVEAHVAGPDDAQDGVEVGAVVVQETADLVDGGGDLGDVLLEEAQRVRVGQHDAGHVLVEHRPQRGHVDAARGRRSGTVTTSYPPSVTDAGLVPWAESGMITLWRGTPLGLVPGAHEQEPGELAGRTGRRLEGGGGHARHLAERLLELDQQSEPALGHRRGSGRVDPGQAGQAGHRVAHLGVVLHRARPERVGARGRR